MDKPIFKAVILNTEMEGYDYINLSADGWSFGSIFTHEVRVKPKDPKTEAYMVCGRGVYLHPDIVEDKRKLTEPEVVAQEVAEAIDGLKMGEK